MAAIEKAKAIKEKATELVASLAISAAPAAPAKPAAAAKKK